MATKDFSSKQEKAVADFLGWDVVSGSGARACHPGDIISDEWLGECKTHETSGKPIFFSSSVWKKICDEAIAKHRNPVLITDDGSQKIDRTWVIINRFNADSEWSVLQLDKKFKTNISMSHAALAQYYRIDDILNQVSERRCISASFNGSEVVILPLSLFRYMFG